jgi:hypothetical protein
MERNAQDAAQSAIRMLEGFTTEGRKFGEIQRAALRRTLPYVVAEGKLLNRDYHPLHIGECPWSAEDMPCPHDGNLPSPGYLFFDGTAPWSSAEAARAYLVLLRALSKTGTVSG